MSNETQESKMMALEQYKILYQAYADEIKNLWQRSIFLATFMVLVWTGYGVSLLKFLETTKENKLCQSTCTHIEFLKSLCELLASLNVYHFILLALCGIIIILSLLWIAMAKGSKFVQEAHERHIEKFLEKCENEDIKSLFCKLDEYEDDEKLKLDDELLWINVNNTLKAYRYSPSKINIFLGWVSCSVGSFLFALHTLAIICPFICFFYACLTILLLFIVLFIWGIFSLKSSLKADKTNENQISKQGA